MTTQMTEKQLHRALSIACAQRNSAADEIVRLHVSLEEALEVSAARLAEIQKLQEMLPQQGQASAIVPPARPRPARPGRTAA